MRTALVAGAVAGTLLFFYQYFVMVPRIVAAEAYESRGGAEAHEHGEWKPDEGWERNVFTAAGTILTGIGFAAVLVAAVTLGGFDLNVRRGLLWGLGGFACFAVAPALGLPPVPPGVPVSDVRGRQLWWVMTVAGTAVGLLLIFVLRRGWIGRIAGGALLVAPHVIGAPEAGSAGIVPSDLVRTFAMASIAGNGMFWLVLGAMVGFLWDE
jgi:cobalt transporter subunit CbtA